MEFELMASMMYANYDSLENILRKKLMICHNMFLI